MMKFTISRASNLSGKPHENAYYDGNQWYIELEPEKLLDFCIDNSGVVVKDYGDYVDLLIYDDYIE